MDYWGGRRVRRLRCLAWPFWAGQSKIASDERDMIGERRQGRWMARALWGSRRLGVGGGGWLMGKKFVTLLRAVE